MLNPRYNKGDSRIEIGIDEAGRGSLWGPLVAAAVIWPAEGTWTEEIRAVATQIKDSKKLSAKRRAVLEEAIKRFAVGWGVGRVEASEIDEWGMTRANRTAFLRAVEAIPVEARGAAGSDRRLLIDGILGLQDYMLEGAEQVVEAKGDGTYLAIAAASILAKEGHDRMVADLCRGDGALDEKYGLLGSKGYGTAAHREAIKTHGMHGQHRRLFLRKLLGLEHNVSGGGGGSRYDFIED